MARNQSLFSQDGFLHMYLSVSLLWCLFQKELLSTGDKMRLYCQPPALKPSSSLLALNIVFLIFCSPAAFSAQPVTLAHLRYFLVAS